MAIGWQVVCRRRVAGAQWLAGGVCLALSPTISCATQSPCHKNRLLCLTVALIFAFGYVFGPNLDQTAPPPRLTACLPQMLPPALGDSVVAPVCCRPFYDQHSDSLLLLTQILRCRLSLIWTVEIPGPLKLVPWLLLWFQGFGRMGEKYEASPPGLCSMATLAAAHITDRCFRQGDNTQCVHEAGVYILYAPLACCCWVSLSSTTDFRPPVRMWGQSGPIPGYPSRPSCGRPCSA